MADIALMKTAAEQQLAAAWQGARNALPGPAGLREASFRRFESAGLPHRRVEEWKYTDLRALMRDAKPLAQLPDQSAREAARSAGSGLGSIEARRLVLVDGSFVPELSELGELEPGVTIRPMAESFSDPIVAAHLGRTVPNDDVAVALNTAFMQDGVFIHLAAGATLARPLHLVFANSRGPAASVYARSLVILEERARAMLIESHEGPAGCEHQVNAALDLVVGNRAHLDHVKVTGEGAGALHVSSLMAAVGANARFNEFLFVTGGAVVRNQLFLRFAGEGTVAGIRGANLLKDRLHSDLTLLAEHAAKACISREVFKSVVDDSARSVFQGRIIVRPHAQQTDARMATHALLLSDNAEADNKPELEIYADDVQCGHGATAGALDRELLFYLQARGIPPKEAEALLIAAFVGEAVEGIEHAGLREALMEQVADWLKARGTTGNASPRAPEAQS